MTLNDFSLHQTQCNFCHQPALRCGHYLGKIICSQCVSKVICIAYSHNLLSPFIQAFIDSDIAYSVFHFLTEDDQVAGINLQQEWANNPWFVDRAFHHEDWIKNNYS
jgi:hypothetical protein